MRKYPGQFIDHADKDPRVPLIIRELGPTYIDITAEHVHVELHGGFDHYGFYAYAENVDYGDDWSKLINGLYYYTE